jgi:ribose transport system ATP-binding protein
MTLNATPGEPLLRLTGLGKTFATPVLRGVDLDIVAGEVHALMGANGAGKSTLARIMSGLIAPTAGKMLLDGNDYRPGGKRAAEMRGVQIVQQELTLIPTLSIAENLFLDRLPSRFGMIRARTLRQWANRALAMVGLSTVDPATPTERLGVGEQQLVEIARALSRSCRLLILDEPTAALSAPQVEQLFENVARLRAAGVAIIYISHRLDELRRIADRITVLRDGQIVATRPSVELHLEEAVRLMVGTNPEREVTSQRRPKESVVLRVHGLSRGDRVRDVSFELHGGEVLGLSGLVGSGRTELLRALFGADRAESGSVQLTGMASPRRFRSPQEAVRAGMGMVPEDRKTEGLLLPLSVRSNLTLGLIGHRQASLGRVDRRREQKHAEDLGQLVEIRYDSVEQPVGQLSGGNQQKMLMGRWLLMQPQVMLLDEPTRGVDVAAKFAVYRLIDELASQGKGIIVVSSEVEELMLLCDRIGVISAGRLVRIFERGDWSQESLLAAAFEGYTDPSLDTDRRQVDGP